ncbi:MAG TPA: fatty acid desaturase, partial [Chitinophagaceae bacterium]|nr:fatty acid desaturase [Chitinophagaceae bacterium]
MAKVTFKNNNNLFFQALKKSVEEYFQKNNIKKTGDWRLYSKALILFPLSLTIYILLLTVTMPVGLSLALCGILGLCIASIGFNVMHDACHGSYSSKKWVNTILGHTLNAMGGNAFFWKTKHNV